MFSQIELIIFDFDKTLRGETIFPQTYDILEYLIENNYKVSIASYNKYSDWFCIRYDIHKYVDFIEGYWANDKIKHINNIIKYYSTKYQLHYQEKNILFVDDTELNLYQVQKLMTNITCLKVDPDTGVQLSDIKRLLPAKRRPIKS